MSTTDTFLAIFLGSKTSPRMAAWNSLSEEVRRAKMQEGIAAWKAWAEKHRAEAYQGVRAAETALNVNVIPAP